MKINSPKDDLLLLLHGTAPSSVEMMIKKSFNKVII